VCARERIRNSVCERECARQRKRNSVCERECARQRKRNSVCDRESVLDRGSESVVKREGERRDSISMYIYSLYSKFSLFSLSISLSHSCYLSLLYHTANSMSLSHSF
jgi:hypothetical protein